MNDIPVKTKMIKGSKNKAIGQAVSTKVVKADADDSDIKGDTKDS